MKKSVNPRRQWTLLLVADNGQMVPLPRARAWLYLFGLVVAASFITAGVAVVFHHRVSDRNRRLRAELVEVQGQLENLNQERDLLMARLAATRVQLKAVSAEAEDRKPGTGPIASAVTGGEPRAESAAAAVTGEATGAPPSAQAEPMPPAVGVEDFRIDRDAGNEELRVQFKLINTTGDASPISGHAFVVFKAPSLSSEDWLVLPQVPLYQGKPAPSARGRSYAIARFNTISFPAGSIRRLREMSQATVLVYDTEGSLLLEKDFPVRLPSD